MSPTAEATFKQKFNLLPADYRSQLLEFLDYLVFRTKKSDQLSDIQKSLKDLKMNKTTTYKTKQDLEKHFSRLGI